MDGRIPGRLPARDGKVASLSKHGVIHASISFHFVLTSAILVN